MTILTSCDFSSMCCRASNSSLFNAGNEMEFLRKLLREGCSLAANDDKFDTLSNDDWGVVSDDWALWHFPLIQLILKLSILFQTYAISWMESRSSALSK